MQIEKPLLFPPTGCSVFKAYPVIFLGSMIALSALGNFELEQRPNRSSQSWVFGANASPYQPNRILTHKPTCIRLVIPEEVVMQPRFTVGILVLQAEGLVCAIRYLGFLFQTTPAGIVAEPQEVAVLIGHLTRDADWSQWK